MKRVFFFILFFVCLPFSVLATTPDQILRAVYDSRLDLQKAFDITGLAVPNSAAGFLIDLTDWAEQYGWREFSELSDYAPASYPEPAAVSTAVPEVTAPSYIVMDKNSGLILAEKNSAAVWPIASITKLMTASIVLDSGESLDKVCDVKIVDDVGGAKLYVSSGATFTLNDLIYAALVGSANNAANAIARATGLDKVDFIEKMNKEAAACGLPHTRYTDPSGIEPTNVSTARETAKLARQIFSREDFRNYTSTAVKTISVLSTGETKKLTNTNWLLWKPVYDDIYVMAGKTGYLDESGWNLVTALRPVYKEETRELIVVVFGSASRGDSTNDAKALAEWGWGNYEWK